MRVLIIGAVVFAVLAVAAAELGWFDPKLPTPSNVAGGSSARPDVSPARGEATGEPDETDRTADEPTSLEVYVERAYEDFGDEVDEGDEGGAAAEDEEALPHFTVEVSCGAVRASQPTGNEGRVEFSQLPADQSCLVVARAPGWSVGANHCTPGDDCRLVVSKTTTIELHVVDGHHRPVAGAVVQLAGLAEGSLVDIARASVPGLIHEPPKGPVSSDEGAPAADDEIDVEDEGVFLTVPPSGVLTLTSFTAGSYTAIATVEGRTAGERHFVVHSDQREVVTFVLERAAEVEVAVSGPDAAEVEVVVMQGERIYTRDDEHEWRFTGVQPGEVEIEVDLDGAVVWSQTINLGEGEKRLVDVKVALAAVDVVVDTAALQTFRPNAGRSVSLRCGPAVMQHAPVNGGHARFLSVPQGQKCLAWFPDLSLASVEAVAPATVRLGLPAGAVELVARNGKDLVRGGVSPLDDSSRIAGVPAAAVAKVLAAPGRYRFSGAVGDATIERDFTVIAGQQRVVLEPPPLRCFTASYVDRKTGEELEGTITAYERVGSGYQPLQLAKVGPRSSECFDAARVATLALSSDGYVPVVMNAGSEDLGVVALTAAESGSRVLADAVELDDGGGFVVRGGEIEAIGLRPGDRLVSIEGTSVAGLVLDEVSSRLEGPTGSVVKLTVRGSDGVRELALARP